MQIVRGLQVPRSQSGNCTLYAWTALVTPRIWQPRPRARTPPAGKRPSGSPSEPWAARQASQRMCSRRQRRPPTRILPSRPQRPKPRPRTSPLSSSRTPSDPRRPRRLWASRVRWELPRIQRHPRRPRNLRAHAGGPSARPPSEGTSSRTGKRRRRRPRRFRRARTRRARRPPGACKRRRSAWMMT